MPEYDLIYIHERYMDLPLFDDLYKAWIYSGCLKNLKPSIDRIDSLVHYTKDNIQMMTWGQNRFKQRSEMSIIRARKVYMHDGIFNINVFDSVSNAVKSTGLNQSGISMCLNNKRQTCGGYMWSYTKERNIHEQLNKERV